VKINTEKNSRIKTVTSTATADYGEKDTLLEPANAVTNFKRVLGRHKTNKKCATLFKTAKNGQRHSP
jgi:hypothetical protein